MVTMETPLALALPKQAAKKLADGGLDTVGSLLGYTPLRYYQWGKLTAIESLAEGEYVTVLAEVVTQNLVQNRSGRGVRLLVDVTDGRARLTCTFFAKNPYMLSHHQRLLKPGTTALLAGKVSEYRGKKQLVQPDFDQVEEGSEQDIARRAGRPIPIYRSVSGLASWKIASLIASVLEQVDDDQFVEIIDSETRARHALLPHGQALRFLHQPGAPVDHQSALRTLAWEEALVLQTALLFPRRGRRGGGRAPLRSAALPPVEGRDFATRLISSLPFHLTGGQMEAWNQISTDIEQHEPMQRLLQGDVGAGKTIIALLAMLRCVANGYQAALLAPTEVLANQHYQSLSRIMENADLVVPIHLLTAKRAGAEKDQVLIELAGGGPGLVVGTHALLQDSVDIPNLALLVVDEQHRFGVAQREQLRTGRDPVPHLLVMTATPIPRTIAMTVFGDLDVTAMHDLPSGRRPIQTFLIDERNAVWMERMWDRAREEVDRGGRVYVVCPRIDASGDAASAEDPLQSEQSSEQRRLPSALETYEQLSRMPRFQGVSIELAHGRRTPALNSESFARFSSGDAPVMVATTVVEVGVDVPEATMMIILDGTRFGLSQLHQLRGRVGRSDRASICMITHPGELSDTSAERLEVIASTTDGFALAEADLRLRREGDVLGKDQSGKVSSLQFLSVRRDVAIIQAARDRAEDILQVDPTLASHPGLADAVTQRAGEELVWLERS